MAPKRSTPKDHPPPPIPSSSSSSSEEETSSGNDDESSSSEDEGKNVISSQTLTQKPEDSDSDSESDDVIVPKPIASKPIQQTASPKKPRSQISKRVAGNDLVSHPKKIKENDVVLDSNKKQLFQRLFSEDDEIVLLKGIIEFTEQKGVDPMKDFNGFYEFVKSSISADYFSVSQLKDKVGRLKRRFENNVSKSKVGENKTFSKPQAQQVFDLMRKIWGSEGVSFSGAESSFKSNGKARKSGVKSKKEGSSNLELLRGELGIFKTKNEGKKVGEEKVGGFRFLGMEDYVVRMGMDVLEEEKKVEMEKKWKELHEAELELFLRRSELVTEQAKLVLAAAKNKKD